MSGRVSVVVPTKNREALLREALTSIGQLAGPDLDLEVIVADNGSCGDIASLAQEFGACLVSVSAPGPAAARNAALRVATGDYIAFLDDDDLWLPGHLRPHLALLQTRPEFGAAVGRIMLGDERGRAVSQPYPQSLPDDGQTFQAFLSDQLQLGAFVVRAGVREQVGEFDERLAAGEDWDWYLRLALRHRVAFVPVTCLLFRMRPPGPAEDAYNERQLRFCRRVFWRAVRRAGEWRPSVATLMRLYLRHNGRYASYFLSSAAFQAARRDRRAARHAVRLAIGASPFHVIWAFSHLPDARGMALALFTPGRV